MEPQILNYSAGADIDSRRGLRRRTIATFVLAAFVIMANVILLGIALNDRSWNAVGIAIAVGPITNGLLALVSLAFIPVVRRFAQRVSVAPFVLTAILLPACCIVGDYFYIGSILHR
jgi:hypothetical protein